MTTPGHSAATDAERVARHTYTAWLRHGLDVAAAINLEPLGETSWPRPKPASGRPSATPPVSPIASSALENARSRGWLLTGPAPASSADGRLRDLDVAVKDIIDVAGLPTRNGTPLALWRDPDVSATVWERLARAGARCVGKTATHEMAWGVTTPQISHPFDPFRIAGGSSGGSAACVAGGAAHIALGTDTGGSIRIPASLCGVVGFRPTTGAVDSTGITALAPTQDAPGILAPDMATCVATLEVLLDRDLGSVGPDNSRPLRVGILAHPGHLQPVVEAAYDRTLTALEESGVTLVRCETDLPRKSASISLLTMLLESAQHHASQVRADPHGFGPEARTLLTLGLELSDHAVTIATARHAMLAMTSQLFDTTALDALITPTTPCIAPQRGADAVEIAGRAESVDSALTRFTAWAPVVAMPAVSVPMSTKPLTAGIQIMAPPNREDLCIRLALTIERLTRRNAA